jgi:hypothetical protein
VRGRGREQVSKGQGSSPASPSPFIGEVGGEFFILSHWYGSYSQNSPYVLGAEQLGDNA